MTQYFIYLLTNWNNKVLYIGVTNDLEGRVYEHSNAAHDSFVKRYKLYKLVYLEDASNTADAISREKQLKSWRCEKKNALITSVNPEWTDLLPPRPDPSLRSG